MLSCTARRKDGLKPASTRRGEMQLESGEAVHDIRMRVLQVSFFAVCI